MIMLYVEWRDSVGGNGQWFDADDIDVTDDLCKTVGILKHEDDDVIILVQSDGHKQLMSDLQIPKGAIMRRVKLGEVLNEMV